MYEKVFTSSLTMRALAVSLLAKLVALLSGLDEETAMAISSDFVVHLLILVSIVADLVAGYGRSRAKGPLVLKKDDARIEE